MAFFSNPNARTTGLNSSFAAGVRAMEPRDYGRVLGMGIERPADARTFNALFRQPGGQMVAFNYGSQPQTVPNVEETLAVSVSPFGMRIIFSEYDEADDLYGGMMSGLRAGTSVVQHQNDLYIDGIENGRPGGTLLGPDGLTMFNTAHPASGVLTATQSNVVTGTGTTVAQIVTDLMTARTRLRGFLGYDGNFLFPTAASFNVYFPTDLSPQFGEVNALLNGGASENNTGGDSLRSTSGDLRVRFNFFEIQELDADANDYYVQVMGPAMLPPLVIWRRGERGDRRFGLVFDRERVGAPWTEINTWHRRAGTSAINPLAIVLVSNA